LRNLIVTEKNITARKIAQILSKGRFKTEKSGKYPVYVWNEGEDEFRCFGLKGHILKVDFPKEYSRWEKVDFFDLIQAPIDKIPIEKGLVSLLKKEARKAERLIIATDFDREGELIGYDVLSLAKEENPQIEAKRARFSALTKEEIEKAFMNLHEPYLNLAFAGESRQVIDLVWGATLTRYLSITSKRLGKNFLSVGRVQSPTLALIVKREEEIRNFIPETFYQVEAELRKDEFPFRALYEVAKLKSREEAEKIAGELGKTATAVEIEKREVVQKPPSPFNTTEFLAAASKIGISPGKAMSIAENLYTQGYISYPRVDNTVYPTSLNLKSIVRKLTDYAPVKEYAHLLLEKGKLIPTRGKKESTDHPPIHPTGEIPKSLKEDEMKIYDLVVRRFLATLSEGAVYEVRIVRFRANDYMLHTSGLTYKNEGFLKIYPYLKDKVVEIPELSEGEVVEIAGVYVLEKQTKPKGRYSQAGLIREMERLGLGTKSTRHSIIQTLYERGYIHGNPIQPTELGMAVGRAILNYLTEIATHEMTARLEEKMNMIEEGRETKESVVEESRKDLELVLEEAMKNKDSVSLTIREGALKDLEIGPCPLGCGGILVVKKAKNKKRFLGCSNYSQGCQAAFPLPQKGKVISAAKICENCGVPMVKIINKGRKPWILCPNPECRKENGEAPEKTVPGKSENVSEGEEVAQRE
jgi:DNA topoisomerase-1